MSPDRAAGRGGFDERTRLTLVETDMDEMRHDIENHLKDFRKELRSVQRVLIGILVSLTTAAVLLAINIAVVGK